MSRAAVRATRALLALCALHALFGCTNERAFAIDIVAAAPVPEEVVAWELRIAALEPAMACPTAEEAASAAPVGRLAHAQTFTDVGMSVGEISGGRWAFAVLGREEGCAVRVYGCSVVEIGGETLSPIAIRVEPVAASSALCGACRSCAAGGCAPVASVCP